MTGADDAWQRSEDGYELPDGSQARMPWLAVTVADRVGLIFRVVEVDRVDYPGHLQDAALTLWLASMAEEELRAASRASRKDPERCQELASEWWEQWFNQNRWDAFGAEYLEAVNTAQQIWGDIYSSKTQPVADNETETEAESGAGVGKR